MIYTGAARQGDGKSATPEDELVELDMDAALWGTEGEARGAGEPPAAAGTGTGHPLFYCLLVLLAELRYLQQYALCK